jgi:hypothetical protein
MKHIVAISGGKDSTAMALRLAEVEPRDYEFCITPTGRELPEMHDHWKKLECLLGKPLTRVPCPDLTQLIIKQKCLPNQRMRWCTRMVKIEPFIVYAMAASPAACYVGIRADEVGEGTAEREGTNWNGIEGVTQDLPFQRWGWGLSKVMGYLDQRGVVVPERTDCDLCYHQRLGEWWRLWKLYPDRYAEAEALELFTGHTLRSAQRDTWPAGLKELRERFERGFVPKGADQLNMQLNVSERSTMCAWCAR